MSDVGPPAGIEPGSGTNTVRTKPGIAIRTLDGVRIVAFDRPEARNALNRDAFLAATEALVAAASDADVKVVVLTGTGDSFCAGADIKEMADPAASEEEAGAPFHGFVDALDDFPKPLLAAVNGVAVGFGVTLLIYCDLVVVADGARFRAPFVQMGLVPEGGSSALLPVRIGWQEAARMLFTSEWIDADGAVASGLALRAVPAQRLEAEVLALATAISAAPVDALIETKRLLVAYRPDARAARSSESLVFRRLLAARRTESPEA